MRLIVTARNGPDGEERVRGKATSAGGTRLPLPSVVSGNRKVVDGRGLRAKAMSISAGDPADLESAAIMGEVMKVIRLLLRTRGKDLKIEVASGVHG